MQKVTAEAVIALKNPKQKTKKDGITKGNMLQNRKQQRPGKAHFPYPKPKHLSKFPTTHQKRKSERGKKITKKEKGRGGDGEVRGKKGREGEGSWIGETKRESERRRESEKRNTRGTSNR